MEDDTTLEKPFESTICFNLGFLYSHALARKDETSAGVIKACFIMAKKMHNKLVEYKHGSESPEKTSEEEWLKELDELGKRKIWRMLTK